MGKSQKKRLLAASERFRRNYFYFFGLQRTDANEVTHIPMHIEKRVRNHRRVWK